MAVGPHALEAVGPSGAGRLARLREWWEQEEVFGYGLILPALALLVALVAFPFGMAIYFSLSDYWVGSQGGFVGLANYREILGNDIFRQTVQNSFVFTAIALTLKTVLGVWLAVLLARPVRFKRLIRGAVLLPFVIPTALSTLGWLWMFDSLYSVVNWTGIRFGLISAPGPNWLAGLLCHGGGDHRERLEGVTFLRHHHPGGSGGGTQGILRSGGGGRRRRLEPILACDAAPAQARARGGDPLLHHLHLRRLQYR